MKKFFLIVIAVLGVAMTTIAFGSSADEPCRSCKGRGWNVCDNCDGHGWRECTFCEGEGYVVNRDGTKETCANCRGKKGFKCHYCQDGHRECKACDGTGKQRYI